MLEAHGTESLNDALLLDWASPVSAASRAVRALGVTSGMSVAPDDGVARLDLAVMYGGAVDIDSVTEAVETVASRDDNRKKLREPPVATSRHLFVLLDWSGGSASWAAQDAIEHETMPRMPKLPDPITTVWVPASPGSVLYVSPPEPWQKAHLPNDFETSVPRLAYRLAAATTTRSRWPTNIRRPLGHRLNCLAAMQAGVAGSAMRVLDRPQPVAPLRTVTLELVLLALAEDWQPERDHAATRQLGHQAWVVDTDALLVRGANANTWAVCPDEVVVVPAPCLIRSDIGDRGYNHRSFVVASPTRRPREVTHRLSVSRICET